MCSLFSYDRVTNILLKVVNKLGLSYSSTKELNHIIDNVLPGCPAFKCCELIIGGETLELYFQDILNCIQSIYSNPELAQDLFIAPECHFTDPECHRRSITFDLQ